MSDTANKKKSRKGGNPRNNKVKNGQPKNSDTNEVIAESPQVSRTGIVRPPLTPYVDGDHVDDQSLPTTPHRAFRAFNDSVDNVNLDDVRDMLPEDTWRDVQPEGLDDEGKSDLQDLDATFVGAEGVLAALNAIPEDDSESAFTPVPSPFKNVFGTPQPRSVPSSAVKRADAAPREVELELELLSAEDCSSGTESLGHAEGSGLGPDSAKRAVADLYGDLYDPKYRYGPAEIKKRRGRGVFSLQSETAAGGRSYAEVAEAVVLTVFDAVRPSSSPPTFRTDQPKCDRSSSEDAVLAERDRAAGLGRRVRGALGYVLHTALSLVYTVFVHYPLELLLVLLSFWWGLFSLTVSVTLGTASWVWGVFVWCLLLPVRLLQRGAVLAWQKTLLLAVRFLNSHPASGAVDTDAEAVHKHTIPTAINGHAHHKH